MVHEARAMHGGKLRGLCADAEQLPLADASVDVIFSNLALQWCEDLPGAMCEIARVLVRGGCAAICTLGADTLWELRAAWRTVDQSVHVNRYYRAIAELRPGWPRGGRSAAAIPLCAHWRASWVPA
jgi:malonyl-CoA O-methyltransferase